MSVDEARLLPRYRLEQEQARVLTQEMRRAQQDNIVPINPSTRFEFPDPVDLRGIPCIARGVPGTQPHTNPLTETIHRLT